MNVLIVDDHPTNRKLLRATLEAEDYQVVEAGDGEQALSVLVRQEVDAVISDILMPNMDGYRLCHEIRHDRRLQHLPVVFYTSTYTSPGDRELAISVGVDSYLTKPMSADDLMAALKTAISDSKERDQRPMMESNTQIMMKKYSSTLVNKLEEKNAELERTVTSLREAHDRIAELNSVLEDRVRERTAQLQAVNRQLRQQNEEIQSFYHTLSHELKTPLTSAGEFIALVAEGLAGTVNETQIEYLELAHESCDQMRVCLNDLLDSARLDTGKFTLELKKCSVGELVERAVSALNPVASRKKLTISTRVQPELPELMVDPHRITQVVNNLVNNAIKFTPESGRISVAVSRSDEARGAITVCVEDTGPGISTDNMERIFERLYQVKSGDSATEKGMGLGLYLCRQLIELHGGTIRAQSEMGKGSVFSFHLPREATRGPHKENGKQKGSHTRKEKEAQSTRENP